MLNTSLRDLVRALPSEPVATLIPARARAALDQLLTAVPLRGSGQVECRLGSEGSGQIDFLGSVSRFERDDLLRALSRQTPLPAGLSALERLLRAWCDAGSNLHSDIPVVWTEFDDVVKQAEALQFEANQSVALMRSYVAPSSPLFPEEVARVLSVAREASEVIRARTSAPAELAKLASCIAAMPVGGHWIHLSVMSQRTPSTVKLYGVLPATSLQQLLEAMAWRGDYARMAQALRRYRVAGETDLTYVDVVVVAEPAIAPSYLGICLSSQQLCAEGDGLERVSGLLDQLVADGLCTPAEAFELERWAAPGASQAEQAIERWLDIKLVMHPERPLSAKAYLGFSAKRAAVGLGLSASRIPPKARYR